MTRTARPRWQTLLAAVTVAMVGTAVAPETLPLAAQTDHSTPVVETAAGPVVGTATADVRRFRGIPYAAPPVGPLRWRSPAPAVPWSAPRDASRPGHRCPQLPDPTGAVAGDEDCLVLDVTAPGSATPDRLRPVMVWLHGAGAGAGAGSDFDARRLAVEGDVVVVTVNYRLGVFGFFGYSGLAGSGGFGLEDQQAALRWVRRNAAAFGGDPANVTLFGESSGGMNTCAHLTSPMAVGLFDRAIVQSGSCLMDLPANALFPEVRAASIWATPAEVTALGGLFAGGSGCEDPATALACLRALPAEDLLRQPLAMAYGRAAYGNGVLPVDPATALRAGRFHRVPVLSGATRDEATFFAAGFGEPPIDAGRYRRLLVEAFGAGAGRVAAEYPVAAYADPALAWAAVVTDVAWVCPTLAADALFADHVPIYAYEFADREAPAFFPPPAFPLGAYHGSELAYLFDLDGWNPGFTPDQQRLSDTMIRYWSNFAAAGDPNGPDLPQWEPFRREDSPPFVQSLAPGTGGIGPVDLGAGHRCGFWGTINPLVSAAE